MADIKISELEPTTELEGLYTIGSDKNNLSKKVSLQFVKDAANYAIEQGEYAKSVGDSYEGKLTELESEIKGIKGYEGKYPSISKGWSYQEIKMEFKEGKSYDIYISMSPSSSPTYGDIVAEKTQESESLIPLYLNAETTNIQKSWIPSKTYQKLYYRVYTSVAINNLSLIIKHNGINDRLEDNVFELQNNVAELFESVRCFDRVENGYIDIENGVKIIQSSNNNTIYSPLYIRVATNKLYLVEGLDNLTSTIYLYDFNKSFLGLYENAYFKNFDRKDIVFDSNVHYIRIAFRSTEELTKNNYNKNIWLYSGRGFDGGYSTSSYDNNKTPGVFVRVDKDASRGGVLFVSNVNGEIIQGLIEVNSSGIFSCKQRTFNEESNSWGNFETSEFLKFPAVSLNGSIIFTNDKLYINGTAYLYQKDKRYTLPNDAELTQTAQLSRLVWERKNNVIFDSPISTSFDEFNNITLGFIVRDIYGNVKELKSSIAAQSILYPNVSQKEYFPTDVKYIPHRGVRSSEIPESTTYSVMFASIYGLKYSECDVQYTSDGVGVVMHDSTINRVMCNSDLTEILYDVVISENTYEQLSKYVYKSTNPYYRRKLQTIREYIESCKQCNICPIIQGNMNDEDLLYCMKMLGDNWICYSGDFSKLRAYSDNVLYLTSEEFDSVSALEQKLRRIGGKVGISKLYNVELTDEIIDVCKRNKWEIMASYSYDKESIPDAIRRGATIVMSDNICGNVNKILTSSIKGWNGFLHNGRVENGVLQLSKGQYLNYTFTKRGKYKIFAQFSGVGSCLTPIYNDNGELIMQNLPMTNGEFVYTFLKLDDSEITISIDAQSEITLDALIMYGDEIVI